MKLPNECLQQFAEVLAESDEWAEWIDENFEKTDNKDDVISKKEMLAYAQIGLADPSLKFNEIND